MVTLTARAPAVLSEASIDLGGVSAPVLVRVDRRARRLIVRVDPTGRVIVTAPSRRAAPEALAFARSRSSWISAQIEAFGPLPFAPGAAFPLEGVPVRIVHAPETRGVRLSEDRGSLVVGSGAAHLNRRVVDWLKSAARQRLTARVDAHVEKLGAVRGRIVIRDPASRWGSCSSTGALSFSWRLILAPPEMLDYVAAHEVAHLLHMNHSPRFWRVVAALGADAAAARRWFARHGMSLHRWGRLQAS